MNSLLLERLQALHDELEFSRETEPEEFVTLALTVSRATTRAAFAEMIAASRDGTSDLELAAAIPLAVGFLVNCALNACACNGNAEIADRLFEKIREVTRELGDGAHNPSPVSPAVCH